MRRVFLLSSPILPTSQSSEHGNLLRYAAALYWDSAGTKIETQTKLSQAEFRYLSQRKTGWGWRSSKPPSTDNLQATYDYSPGMLTSGFDAREEMADQDPRLVRCSGAWLQVALIGSFCWNGDVF